ncbi:MAG: AAA family ATPase [Hydrogenophaga sp.]|uniref:AAA family ATPase n=1 Tax=Hydrogenophaga sp. TaxID=1904254 RepID=UPI004035D3A4
MLIEFSLENFRSIRSRQTLSMVAASRLRRKENTFIPATKEKLPPLLKVAAVYGPNASGKSNLIKGLDVLWQMTIEAPTTEIKELPANAFRFDSSLQNKPSSFEVHFIQEGLRYSFELGLTKERVTKERLVAYPNGKEELLYVREFSDGREQYNFGDHLEGGKDLHETWRRLTGPQVLFLTQAVANSSEDLRQLRRPFNWLKGLRPIDRGMKVFTRFSQQLISEHRDYAIDVAQLLSDFDVPITSITSSLKGEAKETPKSENDGSSASLRSDEKKSPASSAFKTTLIHKTALGEAEFDLSEESDGTINMLGFSLPWYLFRQKIEYVGKSSVLIVDEMDSSLHPKIVEALVRKHLENERPCQLIFTTHDTHLMDTKLLRRDQIWLTERDVNGATQVRCIHDFEGRESEDVEKRYYEGRYRALPLVRGG